MTPELRFQVSGLRFQIPPHFSTGTTIPRMMTFWQRMKKTET